MGHSFTGAHRFVAWALVVASAAALVRTPALRHSRTRAAAGDDLDAFRFAGTARLYGDAARARLAGARAMVVGVGGVGSWAAEALARTGVGHLTLVDLDEVCVSNANRQVAALSSTVGRPKVDVLRDRLRDVNPALACDAVRDFVTAENVGAVFGAAALDVVVDATDDAAAKVAMLRACDASRVPIVVCGAAGGRRDPTRVRARAGDLDVCDDALLRRVRKRYRQARRKAGLAAPAPARPDKRAQRAAAPPPDAAPVVAIYSLELQASRAAPRTGSCDMGLGSSVFVTASFGLAAAAAAVDAILEAAPAAAADDDDEPWEEADCPCSDFDSGGLGAAAAPRRGRPRVGGGSGGPPRPRRRRATRLRAVDTHSHVAAAPRPPAGALRDVVVCSTRPGDWAGVAALRGAARGVALGVHPWWAAEATGAWLEDLRALLVATPGAVVGECGLDRFAGGGKPPGRGAPVDAAVQDAAFRAQLALARDLGRPATVHCVRRVDAVMRAVADERPPTVAFHAFGGAPEAAAALARTVEGYGGRCFFGFADAHRTKHTAALLAALPATALLLESDSDDADSAAALAAMTATVAAARGWTDAEAAAALDRNAAAFLPDD